MPANRNALIRYKTIDQCLQNRYRHWTLEDLIDACSDALYEYEGIRKGVSKRTIQSDIQLMRSDKLGYNAPIVVIDRKYYTYEDPDYSITNIPITEQDLNQLNESVAILKQFKGFSHFRQLDGMIQKLEDHVYSQKSLQSPIIDFEKNEDLKGLEFLDELYRYIRQRKAIMMTYRSFKARTDGTFIFHPYLLKEFRNRWFVIGINAKSPQLMNLALDRIVKVDPSSKPYVPKPDFDAQEYFRHSIGVSVSPNQEPEEITLFVTHYHAPYVLTKPFHPSQKLVGKDYYGITISLEVQHNFELEKEILGFGDGIKVIAPMRLRRKIQERLEGAIDLYQSEITTQSLLKSAIRLEKNGFDILKQVYTQREVQKIKKLMHRYKKERQEESPGIRTLLQKIPDLATLLFNPNLKRIVQTIDPEAFLVKALYFDKPAESNWFVSWHQDLSINVNEKHETADFSRWTHRDGLTSVIPPESVSQGIFTLRIHLDDTHEKNGALQLIPGSHKKRLTDAEIRTISESRAPFVCEVPAGGVQLMKPLLLHASSKNQQQKSRRVIHLEFSSQKLPGSLGWVEKMVL